MKTPKNIDVLFVAGFGPIVRDPVASREFYSEALGLPLKEDTTGYLHTGGLDGVKHFALWWCFWLSYRLSQFGGLYTGT